MCCAVISGDDTRHDLACYSSSCKLQDAAWHGMARQGKHPASADSLPHLRRPWVFTPGDAPHRLGGEQADLSVRHRRPAEDQENQKRQGRGDQKQADSALRVHKSQGRGRGGIG
jgi:hypothetical protein